jgi:carbon storage regulator
MLVISRRTGQSILIGEEIEVAVVEITSGRIKLGIKAPRNIPILRNEIQLTGDANRKAASSFSPEAVGNLVQRLRKG